MRLPVVFSAAGPRGLTANYHAAIDLRSLDRSAFTAALQPEGGVELILAAKGLFCSRNVILEQAKPDYEERCRDTLDDISPPEHTLRLRAAFEVLRRVCRW